MAKLAPEDRFASLYDDLIAALESGSLEGLDKAPGMIVLPRAVEVAGELPPAKIDAWPSRESREYPGDRSPSESLQLVPLTEMPEDRLSGEVRGHFAERSRWADPATPIPHQELLDGDQLELDSSGADELPTIARSKAASAASAWIIAGAFSGIALILLTIGILQFQNSTPSRRKDVVAHTGAGTDFHHSHRILDTSRFRQSPVDGATIKRREKGIAHRTSIGRQPV